ncbi:MAG: hypothetical protein MUD11_01975 [Rhodobacteraceae bacterium]|jgi:Ca2+-binding RTX toxin-like protein|nr:hypothetical protein [Paracoccaceae bacterium]
MPQIDITILGAFDTRQFFAPATVAITAISGTATAVTVVLQSGLTLVYKGTALGFAGNTPLAGSVTGLDVLKPDGTVLASLNLTAAPWNFAEITTGGPFASYLASEATVLDLSALIPGGDSASFIETGNQSDFHTFLGGADTIRAMGGDDSITAFGRYLPDNAAVAGTVLDGGAGVDSLRTNNISVDLRQAEILNIEGVWLQNGASLRLSASQFGTGKIAKDATFSVFTSEVLTIDQVAGKALDISQLRKIGTLAPTTNLIGTSGNDTQVGNAGTNDVLLGFDGDDRLNGNGGADSLFGGMGDDRLFAGDNNPSPQIVPGLNADELRGGDGNDRIYGGIGFSVLLGEAGNDLIDGATGLVRADGGDGNDWIRGGSATFPVFGGGLESSYLFGGAGNDTLVTGATGTLMVGGSGDDRYVINHANNRLEELAGGGNDRVVTTVSVDLTTAGEIERITVKAATGVTVTGTATANILAGNIGADTLNGGAGDDRLAGAGGADVLDGGAGNDTLSGCADADVFVFATGGLRDVISDFADGQDMINLTALSAVTDFADLLANHLRQSGANVLLDAGQGDLLVIRNVQLAQLDSGDFLF